MTPATDKIIAAKGRLDQANPKPGLDPERDPERGNSSPVYQDRPTDDGKYGDGADEPNSGIPG